jgi:hypothetical protein
MHQVTVAGGCGAHRGVGDSHLCGSSRWFHNRIVGPLVLPHSAHETDTLPRKGPDQALILAIIADRRAGQVDACVQGGLRHKASLPDRGEEIVPADYTLAIADEIDQEIEDLGFHGHHVRAAPQLAALGVEGTVFEKISHARAPVRFGHRRP